MSIDGITVLQTIPQTNQALLTIVAAAFVVNIPIFFISILVEGFFCHCKKISNICSKIFTISLLIMVSSSLFLTFSHKTQYKVLINDSVTYNELCKEYDIVDIDGGIVTIEEKEFER